MKGGFRLFSTIALILISLFYLVYPTFQNKTPVNLGLDLQGGMHLTLEVGVDELVKSLASDTDKTFDEVWQSTRTKVQASDADFIDTFVSDFENRDPNARLSRYFRNTEQNITRSSSNADIKTYLNTQADDAIKSSIDVVRNRIDRFGVTEPSIVKQGTRRIVVELPGVADSRRVRRLLRGTAQLQFRLMGDPTEVNASLQQIMAYYAKGTTDAPVDTSKAAKADTSKTAKADTSKVANAAKKTSKKPLDGIFAAIGQVTFGEVAAKDTATVMKLFKAPAVKAMWPKDVTPMWTASPVNDRVAADKKTDTVEKFHLLAVKNNVELTGERVTNSSVEFDQFTNAAEVSLAMDSDGANTWSRLTGSTVLPR